MVDGEDSMAVTPRRRRFTLDEYHRMGETGTLGEDDRAALRVPISDETFSPAASPALTVTLRDLLG